MSLLAEQRYFEQRSMGGRRRWLAMPLTFAMSFVVVLSLATSVYSEPSLRDHRNLYNIDFGTYFWKPEQVQPEGGPFKAESIHRFVRMLADSGVDTYVINPNSKLPWYPSKVVPTILTGYVRDDPDKKTVGGYGPEMLNLLLDLQEANVDWLDESIKASRECGISPWVSVRMNDPHGQSPHMESPFHKDPKYRNGEERQWSKLNFQFPEVRDYYFSIIRELVNDYDFDALELDWKRCPVCMPSPASQQEIDTMTAWFAEVRKLTEAKSQKTGRPYYLGLHIPAEYKKLKNIGIDVKTLVDKKLIDFICPSNFMQTAWDVPFDEIKAELGPELTLYGVTEMQIDSSGCEPCNNPPALRGNAAGKLVLGADGIEQYNFFWATDYAKAHPAICNLDNLDLLRGQSKYYVLPSNGDFTDLDFDRPNPLPITLDPEQQRTFKLPMSAEPINRDLDLTIHLSVEKAAKPPMVGIKFNGTSPTVDAQLTDRRLIPARPDQEGVQTYAYQFNVSGIKDGWNEIELSNHGDEPTQVVNVELAVQ